MSLCGAVSDLLCSSYSAICSHSFSLPISVRRLKCRRDCNSAQQIPTKIQGQIQGPPSPDKPSFSLGLTPTCFLPAKSCSLLQMLQWPMQPRVHAAQAVLPNMHMAQNGRGDCGKWLSARKCIKPLMKLGGNKHGIHGFQQSTTSYKKRFTAL